MGMVRVLGTIAVDDAPVRSARVRRLLAVLADRHPADPPVGGVLLALDEPAPHEGVDEPAGGRVRPSDPLREAPEGHRLPDVEDVERGELGQ